MWMDWTIVGDNWGNKTYREIGNYRIPENPDSSQYLTGNHKILDYS